MLYVSLDTIICINRISIGRLELYIDHHVAAISLASSLVVMRDSVH